MRSIQDLLGFSQNSLQSRKSYVVVGFVSFIFFILVLRGHTGSSNSDTASALAPSPPDLRYVFAFGDDYTDTNFGYLGKPPTVKRPFGNPKPEDVYWNAGGPKWIQKLIFGLSPKNTLCYNFARSYATVDNGITFRTENLVPADSMKFQISTKFHDLLTRPKKKPKWWNAANSVAIVWFGMNDVIYIDNERFSLDDILDSYFGEIDALYAVGLRRFLLFDVPPIGRSPSFDVDFRANYRAIRANIKQWNKLIGPRVADYKNQHEDVAITLINTHPIFNRIFMAEDIGHVGQTKQCHSEDGTTCWWVDNIHPGQEIHNATADAAWEALKNLGFYGESKSEETLTRLGQI